MNKSELKRLQTSFEESERRGIGHKWVHKKGKGRNWAIHNLKKGMHNGQ